MPGLPGVPPAGALSALPRAELARLAGAYQVIGELTARAEQLPARVEQLAARVEQLAVQNERLAARVEQLGRQAGRQGFVAATAGRLPVNSAARWTANPGASAPPAGAGQTVMPCPFPSRIRQRMPGLVRPGMFQPDGRDLTERLQSA